MKPYDFTRKLSLLNLNSDFNRRQLQSKAMVGVGGSTQHFYNRALAATSVSASCRSRMTGLTN